MSRPHRRQGSGAPCAAGRAVPLREAVVAAAALGALSAGACTSAPTFDREAAVQKVVDNGGGKFSRQQAECYVDRVSDQLGSVLLDDGARPTPPQLDRLTSIRIDCAGVASLGLPRDTRKPVRASELDTGRDEPMRRGENVQLDGLWDACEKGSGEACDLLFDAAPIGSDYEAFAASCGGRTEELRCADRYAGMAASGTTLLPGP